MEGISLKSVDIKNRIILLTGATDGIGRSTALRLARAGAELILLGKNPEKGYNSKKEIIQQTDNKNISYFNCDFTSFREINTLSDKIHEKYSHIDVLINNAGIYENEKIILKNGTEKNFMVNHLAPFSLTLNLLDSLKKSEQADIINVSSMIHAGSLDFDNLNAGKYYSGDNAYSMTKLCNILFTYELSAVLQDDNIRVNALHPGVINTKLLRAGWGGGGAPVENGAKHIIYLLSSDVTADSGGKYYMNDNPTRSAEISYDKIVRKKLWDLSLEYMKQSGE